MKRKNISADTALLEVARRHNTTVDEVRKEIRIPDCNGGGNV